MWTPEIRSFRGKEDIASSLGVSRTPVREAFARLQERGLLETSSEGLTIAKLSRQQVMELYALRAKLESAVAAFAAENPSPSDVVSIRHAALAFAAQSKNRVWK